MEVTIGQLSQIPQGEGRNFAVDSPAGPMRVAVFHTRGGDIFATQADCPHLGGPLADGLTDDGAVVCPLHDRTYDLRTGSGIGTECNIQVYPVSIAANGTISLTLMSTTKPGMLSGG